jgi:hypothetical protein
MPFLARAEAVSSAIVDPVINYINVYRRELAGVLCQRHRLHPGGLQQSVIERQPDRALRTRLSNPISPEALATYSRRVPDSTRSNPYI